MIISLLPDIASDFQAANAPYFETALHAQNMIGRGAARSQQTQNRIMPVQQATAQDAYAFVEDTRVARGFRVLVNPKRLEIARNPAVALRNDLHDFRLQLPDDPAYEPLDGLAKYYVRSIDQLLHIRTAEEEQNPIHNAKVMDYHLQSTKGKIELIHSPDYLTLEVNYGKNDRHNWNAIEGVDKNAPRKGAPSLFTLASVQAARLKAEGEDFSAWHDDPEYGRIIDKSFENVGSKSEQISRFVNELLGMEQRIQALDALNHHLRNYDFNQPDFTAEELTASPMRLIRTLGNLPFSFAEFIENFRYQLGPNSPLYHYHRTATVQDIADNSAQTQAANRFRELFNRVPLEKSDEILNDLLRAAEPFKQHFKNNNPHY